MDFSDNILKEHNKEPYIDLVKDLELYNRAIAVRAPGTGKMYLALKWLNDNKSEPFLYIAPNKSILNKFADIILKLYLKKDHKSVENLELENKIELIRKLLNNDNIHFLTYSKLNNMSEEDMRKLMVKRVVIDECHHAVADKWGETIKLFFKVHNDIQVMGLTATPIRPSDKKNVVELLFDGRISTELSVQEAIRKGLLPFPHLVFGIYSFKPLLDNLEFLLDNNLVNQSAKMTIRKKIEDARRIIENADGIEEVFKKYLPKNGKFLVFCSSINDMKEKMEVCQRWVPEGVDLSVCCISSQETYRENQRIIQDFENEEYSGLKLMFCVDMANEGLHIKTLSGIIMLRATESIIVFLQQLGRALAIDVDKVPYVFDLVENLNVMRKDMELFREFAKNIDIEEKGISEKEKYGFAIQAKLIDIVSYLESTLSYYTSRKIRDEICLAYCNDPRHSTLDYVTRNEVFVYQGKKIKIGNILEVVRDQYRCREKPKPNRRPLDDEEVVFFDNLGMIWEPRISFEKKIEIFKKYCAEKDERGNCKNLSYINDREIYKGYKVGAWKARFRRKYKAREDSSIEEVPLLDSQVEILEGLGMDWEDAYTFEGKIKVLREFCETIDQSGKKHTLADIKGALTEFKGYPIKDWIATFRSQYKARTDKKRKNTPLTDEQVMVLESMGMEWRGNRYTEAEKIKILEEYCKETDSFGNKRTLATIKSEELYKGFNIGRWRDNFRKQYKARTEDNGALPLSDETVETLEQLGMVWTVRLLRAG